MATTTVEQSRAIPIGFLVVDLVATPTIAAWSASVF
jgi:aryl carrier-like protein